MSLTKEQLLVLTTASADEALRIAKQYIDKQDLANRQYADQKIETVLQTTDLNAKLALLQEMDAILDGDSASEGFQAWQAQVNKLNTLVADLTTAKVDISTLQQGLTSVNQSLVNINSALSQRITDEVAVVNTTIITKDTATNTRIDELSNQYAQDKIAQVEKDATQSAAIAGNKAATDSVIESLKTEAQTRAEADNAFNQRVTANEQAISGLQAGNAEFATKQDVVDVFTQLVTVAKNVFGLDATGAPIAGNGAVV